MKKRKKKLNLKIAIFFHLLIFNHNALILVRALTSTQNRIDLGFLPSKEKALVSSGVLYAESHEVHCLFPGNKEPQPGAL